MTDAIARKTTVALVTETILNSVRIQRSICALSMNLQQDEDIAEHELRSKNV